MKLLLQAFAGLGFLVAVLAAALFGAAGSFDYWQGWLFLAVFASGVPAALGSVWAYFGVLSLALVIVLRLLDEERALAAGLPGYREHAAKVKYRLIPGVW